MKKFIFPASIIAILAISRLLPHPPNFTPLMAMTIFGAAFLPKKWNLILPVAGLFASDIFLGFYGPDMLFVYGSFLLVGIIARWFVNRGIVRLVAITLLGSVLFFLITNFGVWALWDFYPKTFSGLITCYAAGLPFFRNTLLGDFVYTFSFVGIYLYLGHARSLYLLQSRRGGKILSGAGLRTLFSGDQPLREPRRN